MADLLFELRAEELPPKDVRAASTVHLVSDDDGAIEAPSSD